MLWLIRSLAFNLFLIIFSSLPSSSSSIKLSDSAEISSTSESCTPLPALTNSSIDHLMSLAVLSEDQQSQVSLINSARYTLRASQLYFAPQVSFTFNSTFTDEYDWSSYYNEITDLYSAEKSFPSTITNSPVLQLSLNLLDLQQVYLINSNKSSLDSQIYAATTNAQSLAVDAATAYINHLEQSYIAQAGNYLVDIYTNQVSNTQTMYQYGEKSLLDVLNAQQQLLNYEQTLKQTLVEKMNYLISLNSITNSNFCSFTPSSSKYSSVTLGKPIEYSLHSLNEATTISPLVNQYFLTSDQYRNLASSYNFSAFPNISLFLGTSATYEYGNISGITQPNSEYDNTFDKFVGVNFTVRLDGGQGFANASAANSKSLSFTHLANQEIINLRNNFFLIQDSNRLYIEKSSSSSQSLQLQKRVLQLTLESYQAGYSDYTDFQTQAQNLYQSYNDYYSSLSLLFLNQINFNSLFLFKTFPQTFNSITSLFSNL